MSNVTNGCKDCQKRYVGCHSTCEDYKEYKAKLAEYKKEERRASEASHLDRFHLKY